jgi:hypothetical protein
MQVEFEMQAWNVREYPRATGRYEVVDLIENERASVVILGRINRGFLTIPHRRMKGGDFGKSDRC